LRDTRNERGTQFEAAQIDDDGTLRVTGHHTGPGVSEFFGAAITSYDWALRDRARTSWNPTHPAGRPGGRRRTRPAGRLPRPARRPGRRPVAGPQVAADFSNCHS
jgi:hypothetical protein